MKRIFTLVITALLSLGIWAEDVTINPAAEVAFRTNTGWNGETETAPTAWQNGFPKTEQESIECTYSQRMWAQEMFDVTDVDLSSASKVTLTFVNANNSTYRLGAWIYPNADWTDESEQEWTDGVCPIVENFKSVVGVYPSYKSSGKTYLAYAEAASDVLKVKQEITFQGAALTTLANGVVEKGGRRYVSFIITFRETDASYSTGRNPKYYGIANSTESNRPTMTVSLPDPVAEVDTWNLSNFTSTRTGGSVEVSNNVLNVTSGTDNAKRGDIRNSTDTYYLEGNKVVFYEVSCTANGVTTNAGDRKLGYTATIDAFSETAVVNEQFVASNTIDLDNGHQLIYFDLSAKNANVAYYKGDTGNKFDTDTKNSYRTALTAATDLAISTVNITLIGTDATNFVIYSMGSAKDESALKAAYGIKDVKAITDEKGNGYDNLAAAVEAAQEVTEDTNTPTVYTLNMDVELTERLNVKTKNVTFKGATGSEKILRATSYAKGLMFLTQDELATLTLENLIIDGQNVEATAAVFEASNKGLTVLNNVKIQNAVATSNQGLFVNKSNGKAQLNGVTMTNCSAPESKALVFVGTNNVTISGANDFGALYIEKANSITDAGISGVQALIVDDTREANLVLVKGGNVDNYTVSGQAAGLTLYQEGSNVVLADEEYTKPVVAIGEVGYSSLETALNDVPIYSLGYADVTQPTVITVNKDVVLSGRLNVTSQKVIIRGATGTEKILRAENYAGIMFLTVDTLASLTVENIIIDGQDANVGSVVFESSNKGLTTINNVTIQNASTYATQGIFCNKNRGKTVINGLTMTNCSAINSKALVFVGTSNVTISGTNDFGAIYVEKDNYIIDGGMEGTQAIVVDDTRTANTLLVKNGKVENYSISGQPDDVEPYQTEEGVILATAEYTSIGEIAPEGREDVAYNLSGQRVYKNKKGIVIINGKKYLNR